MHPPVTHVSHKISDSAYVECTPFAQEGKDRLIVQQQNFTNLSLHTIGQQLIWVESQVSKFKTMTDYIPKMEKGETSSLNLEKKVLFKPMEYDLELSNMQVHFLYWSPNMTIKIFFLLTLIQTIVSMVYLISFFCWKLFIQLFVPFLGLLD